MATCYNTLTFPSCKANPSKGIYNCTDPALKGNCCLSEITPVKDRSNCPVGFESDPTRGQFCEVTRKPFTYVHKCTRITSCSNKLFDPKTSCKSCLNSLFNFKSGCTKCNNLLLDPKKQCKACLSPLLDPTSGCTTCLSNPLFAPPKCTSCANPLYAAPGCDTCKNPLFAFPDCTSCANSDQDYSTQCTTCSNSLLEYPGCVECLENKLLAPQECTTCLDPDRVAPDCEKCRQGMFVNPDTNMCVMCGERDCAKAGCGCTQGACVNDVCSCITTEPPLCTNGDRGPLGPIAINMFPSTPAFAYAPKEMFESSAPRDSRYKFYIYGFWGFIQIYDHAIIAMENVYYNSLSPNPAIDIRVNRTAGNPNLSGYRNAVKLQDALFNEPKGLALDKTIGTTSLGNRGYTRPTLFVADSGNHCIRMISVTVSPFYGPNVPPENGTVMVSTLTGSKFTGFSKDLGKQYYDAVVGYKDGNFSEALFNSPTGLDFDSNGVLYVADTGNNAIRKIVIDQPEVNLQFKLDYTGKVSTLIPPEFGLYSPTGVLFHAGYLYVCDRYTIYKIDVLNTNTVPYPTVQIIAGGFPLPPGRIVPEFQDAYGMVFSGKNLLFSDKYGVKILVNAGQMPSVIRPAPLASFPAANRPLAMLEYPKNSGNIVVGLHNSLPVQISGKNCTCFPDILGNC